jgi:hypothetical protein
MKYELAKELEDTGFPQGGKGSFVAPSDKIVLRREDRVYRPTLSELIEACGHRFFSLEDWRENTPDKRFVARADSRQSTLTFYALTPEEAVARLWLVLNRKA